MTIRKIAQLGHPVLRKVAAPVGTEQLSELAELVQDMVETMRDARGAGLAAPQVHESLRLVVMEVQGNARYPTSERMALTVLVNPAVTPLVAQEPLAPQDSIWVYEGCLSVHGLRGRVRRPRKVRVEALDLKGQAVSSTYEGFAAAVIQHEVDHLDGKLFIDRAEPYTLCFLDEYQRFVPPEERIVDGLERAPADFARERLDVPLA